MALKLSRKSKIYMLDENCYRAAGQIVPENFLNVSDIMKQEGIPKTKKSWHDSVILDVAIKRNYIIVTRDKGLTLLAILQGRDIVFSNFEGLHFIKGNGTRKIKKIEDLK